MQQRQEHPTRWITEVREALLEVSSPERATNEKAYLKSELEHLGVTVPNIRREAKRFAREHAPLDRTVLIEVVEAAWATSIHELRVFAVELLNLHLALLEFSDIVLIERLIRESRTWALVDVLAATIVGSLLERFGPMDRVLDRWAGDDDFWVRRSVLLAFLGPLRRGGGDFERFASYADAMLEEREFFIRKAIGWVLRDTARKRPRLVYEWLAPRAGRASGVTVREAVKPLDPADRDAVLRAHRPATPPRARA